MLLAMEDVGRLIAGRPAEAFALSVVPDHSQVPRRCHPTGSISEQSRGRWPPGRVRPERAFPRVVSAAVGAGTVAVSVVAGTASAACAVDRPRGCGFLVFPCGQGMLSPEVVAARRRPSPA